MERVAELALLGGVTWPLLRLVCSRRFWSGFPRFAGTLTGLLALYATLVTGLALRWPGGLRVIALGVGTALAVERWRARPGYGGARGLPPGSLGILPVDSVLDDRFFLKLAARHGPVFKVSQFTPGIDPLLLRPLHPVVCVVGLPESLELLRDYDDALKPFTLPFSRFIPGGFLRCIEEPRHNAYKQIFRQAFSRTTLRECEPFVALRVKLELARMSDPGNLRDGAAPEPHLARLVFGVFVRLFLGIEPGTGDFTRLHTLYHVVDYRRESHTSSRRVRRALAEIETIVRRQIDGVAPEGDAAPGCFLRELARSSPGALRDPTVVGNLIYLLHTTAVDVAGLLGWVLKLLSDQPACVARLRADPQSGGYERASSEPCLATRVVLETLRLEQSEYVLRRVSRQIRWRGFVIPAGWLLRICVRESHRSAAVFDQSERFDPDRFLGRTYTRAEYSPFGALRLACLGVDLTLTVGRVFVNELARGFDWQVLRDGPRELRGWHWKPSSRLRIRLTPRSATGGA